MTITVVGVKQARPGYTFLFSGPADSCRQCEYYRACSGSLESERVYRVMKVLKKELPCILESDKGRVVEVEESSKEVLVDSKSAIAGAIITLSLTDCKRYECKNRDRCFPLGLLGGDRCKILQVGDEITCPLGPRLVLVLAQREPAVS